MTNHLLNNALLGKTWLTCYFLDFKHHWFWGVSCEEKKGGNRDSSWLADRGWYYLPANVYKKYGKSPCLLGKSTINGNFQYCSFLYVYQRVPSILGMRGSQHSGAIFSWVNQHLHHGWCVLIRTTRKQPYFSLSGWWFGTWILFSIIYGNVIIPTDELIFFRGVGIPPTSLASELLKFIQINSGILWMELPIKREVKRHKTGMTTGSIEWKRGWFW